MKKPVLVLGLLLAPALVWPMPPCSNGVFALSGCCMERQSANHPWRPNGKSFDQCKALNNNERDNIFDATGYFWWDVDC